MFNTEKTMQEIREQINKEDIGFSKKYLLTPYCERMLCECRDKGDIIIFGSGSYGRLLCHLLMKEKIGDLRCFCDNNKEKWGSMVDGLYVYSLEDALRKYPSAFFLISVKGYESELMRQLVRANVSVDNIAIFIMEYTGLVVR